MKKSLKIKIALSIIWGAITLLIAGSVVDDKVTPFLISLNLPSLLYWLGFWIWGEGYIKNSFMWLLSPILKEGGFVRKFLLLNDPKKRFPWRRFWARWLDYNIWGFIVSKALEIAVFNFGLILPQIFSNQLFSLLVVASTWAVIEGLLISTCGTTIGKVLLGIRVLRVDGQKLSLKQSIFRSFEVYLKGMALGIPIISLFTMGKSRKSLMSNGSTSWDKPRGNDVIINKTGWLRKITFAAMLFASFYMMVEDKRVEHAIQQLHNEAEKYPKQRTDILVRYLTSVTNALDNKFTPEHIASERYSIASSKQALANARALLDKTRSDYNQTFTDFESLVQRLDLPDSYENVSLEAYNKVNDKARTEANAFFEVENDILDAYEELLIFLGKNQGRYVVENNQFLFLSNSQLKEFNAIMAKVEKLATKEQKSIKSLQTE